MQSEFSQMNFCLFLKYLEEKVKSNALEYQKRILNEALMNDSRGTVKYLENKILLR